MSLLALQRDFRNRLIGEDAGGHGFAVYHNAYRAQLADCLAETFEQTRAWIGGDAFAAAARAHIERTPPSGWTLGVYGDGFDRSLDDLYPDDPEVADLAALEWALAQAFTGTDAAPIDPAALATVDWDSATLRFCPTVRIIACRTNAGAIWSALSAGDPPPAPQILPDEGGLLIWRQDYTPCFRTIEQDERRALNIMIEDAPFATLCATLVREKGEAAGVAAAGGLLGQWLSDGLITAATS